MIPFLETRHKVIVGISIAVLGAFCIYQAARMFAPGSYPFAEIYTVNAPEADVIDAIGTFKKDHPDFVVPNVTIHQMGTYRLTENEGRNENSDRYLIYFYNTKDNQILLTWTRPGLENNTTDFAFVGINDGLDLGNWKDINDDFGFFENRDLKKEFEKNILIPVKNRLEPKSATNQ